jgi:ankyrin repeat protein
MSPKSRFAEILAIALGVLAVLALAALVVYWQWPSGSQTVIVSTSQPAAATLASDVAPFLKAVQADNIPLATSMLATDPSLAQARRGRDGATALHLARSVAMATLLLDHGADLNALDSHSTKPLRWAASRMMDQKQQATALVAFLESKGARETDIYFACATGDVALLQSAITADASQIDQPADDEDVLFGGNAPLQITAYCGQPAAARILLQNGADVHDRTGWNNTEAMEKAAWIGNADIVALLADHGGKINGTDSDYTHSPLYNSACMGRADVVKILLAHGAVISPTLIRDVRDAMQHPGNHGPNPGAQGDFEQVIAELNAAAATQPATP